MTRSAALAVTRVMTVAVALLCLVGCADAGPSETSSAPSGRIATAPETALPITPTPGAEVRTPTATQAPASTNPPHGPRPSPTPPPVRREPTGIELEEDIEAMCDEDDPTAMCGIGDSTFTVTWDRPRMSGIEIRVFGVTACLATDAGDRLIDGWCLRPDTPLPAGQRVLLGKAPASARRLEFTVEQAESFYATRKGKEVYAFVAAAYNADGEHSPFAIIARAPYCAAMSLDCDGEAGPEVFAPGSWMATTVDGVRVRSRPNIGNGSVKYTPLLKAGTEFGIIRGPVDNNGYRWYLVQLTPGTLDGGITQGWVADGSRYGEPWIENIGIDEG